MVANEFLLTLTMIIVRTITHLSTPPWAFCGLRWINVSLQKVIWIVLVQHINSVVSVFMSDLTEIVFECCLAERVRVLLWKESEKNNWHPPCLVSVIRMKVKPFGEETTMYRCLCEISISPVRAAPLLDVMAVTGGSAVWLWYWSLAVSESNMCLEGSVAPPEIIHDVIPSLGPSSVFPPEQTDVLSAHTSCQFLSKYTRCTAMTISHGRMLFEQEVSVREGFRLDWDCPLHHSP